MIPPTIPQLEDLKQSIFAGRKIEAIKLHREATGLGLKESKDAVEQLEVELRKTEEHRFVKGAAQGGCFPMLMLIAFALSFAIAALAGSL